MSRSYKKIPIYKGNYKNSKISENRRYRRKNKVCLDTPIIQEQNHYNKHSDRYNIRDYRSYTPNNNKEYWAKAFYRK